MRLLWRGWNPWSWEINKSLCSYVIPWSNLLLGIDLCLPPGTLALPLCPVTCISTVLLGPPLQIECVRISKCFFFPPEIVILLHLTPLYFRVAALTLEHLSCRLSHSALPMLCILSSSSQMMRFHLHLFLIGCSSSGKPEMVRKPFLTNRKSFSCSDTHYSFY